MEIKESNMKNNLIFILIIFSIRGLSQIPNDVSLIAYWPFSGNEIDYSANAYNGIAHGAKLTQDRFGNENSAYKFDGIDDFIELPLINKLNNQSKITFSLWLKTDFDFIADYSVLFGHWKSSGAPSGDPIGFEVFLSKPTYTNKATINAAMSSTKNAWSTDSLITSGIWNHFVITYDGTQNVKSKRLGIYVNNIFMGNFGNESIPSKSGNSSDMTILGAQISNSLIHFYKGAIDDVAIWNRNLTPEEIANVYNDGICKQSITVTDTLIINLNMTNYNPISYENIIKIYPNPTKDVIFIDLGEYTEIKEYSLKIINPSGQEVYSLAFEKQLNTLDISDLGSNGIYFVQILDSNNQIVDIKKIVLQ